MLSDRIGRCVAFAAAIKLAEEFFIKIEKKYIKNNIYHSYSKEIVFIEDYAFLINSLNDLHDKTYREAFDKRLAGEEVDYKGNSLNPDEDEE